ncbi:hypothetical protein MA16_Dca027966 [Dendrobium catenatum]|uniref:Uncharacterized protein n=1 Tax=Dendrobium catenatum TaxID=906689 RepID=A0A2I0VB35_9ASPA|nr:hypothetical protein MA16_Dca027966 [Dendrobium catenatum]
MQVCLLASTYALEYRDAEAALIDLISREGGLPRGFPLVSVVKYKNRDLLFSFY